MLFHFSRVWQTTAFFNPVKWEVIYFECIKGCSHNDTEHQKDKYECKAALLFCTDTVRDISLLADHYLKKTATQHHCDSCVAINKDFGIRRRKASKSKQYFLHDRGVHL